MGYQFYIEVDGNFDSHKLYELLESYGVNMVAAEGKVWIYGAVKHSDLGRIVQICAKFGKLNATIEEVV